MLPGIADWSISEMATTRQHGLVNTAPLLASDRGRAPVFQVTPHLGLNFPIADDARVSSTYRGVTRYATQHRHPGSAPPRELARTDRHLCDFPELAREG